MDVMKKNCRGMESKLVELLLDPAGAPAKVRAHLDSCGHCREKLAELQAAMALLDAWKTPEPSPYFMTRMDARLREERAAAPAGWLAGLRVRFAYGPTAHIRPLAAMAMTVMLLVGGGAYLGITNWDQAATPAAGQTAVVRDLQTMDNNAQLLDQLEALSTTNENGN